MVDTAQLDQRFGDIAVNMNMVSREKFDRALVIQNLIMTRAKVHLPIGKVLKEMGVLTEKQINEILDAQRYIADELVEEGRCELPEDHPVAETMTSLQLTLSDDQLSAFLSPTDIPPNGLNLEAVKDFLTARNVVFGLVEDSLLADYIAQDPLPHERFKVAMGIPMVPGRPPEVIYHFDTDPMRIGTLNPDGTMDWKNRGAIPQVKEGDLLAEKTEGDPGEPGTSVCGKTLPPSRIRPPKLKCGKGALRSEDGHQILAKLSGTPKIGSDQKIVVFGILNIDGDIGVETGNLEFDGFIEAAGGVHAGYTVKAKGLRTAGIQDAVLEIDEDLVCLGGIYGSHLKVGGNIQASHIHNCTIETIGDLVVKKELYDSTVETNGRCLIGDGKIMSSKIDAKKGIYSRQIGSEASNPNELTVGIDRKYERDSAAYAEELSELERQFEDVSAAGMKLNRRLDEVTTEMGTLAQEQDSYMLQKRQFEEQLRGEGPNPVGDDEERMMLEEMIGELVMKNDEIDAKIAALMQDEDRVRLECVGIEKSITILAGHIEKSKEKIALLDESQKVDPGIPVLKVSGTIYAKTEIKGPHKHMILPQAMQKVRIAESASDIAGKKHQIKISNLR